MQVLFFSNKLSGLHNKNVMRDADFIFSIEKGIKFNCGFLLPKLFFSLKKSVIKRNFVLRKVLGMNKKFKWSRLNFARILFCASVSLLICALVFVKIPRFFENLNVRLTLYFATIPVREIIHLNIWNFIFKHMKINFKNKEQVFF